MGSRERIRAQSDDESRAELDCEGDDLFGEQLPKRVGLVPEEQQHVAARVVLRRVQLDAGPGERGVDAVAQVHDRTASSIVEEPIRVEGRDRRRAEIGDERLGRRGRAEASVDPAFERDDEDGRVEVRTVVQRVERRGLGVAHDTRCAISAAVAAERSTCTLNISKPSRPEPIAPAMYRAYTPSTMHASFQNANEV